MMRLKIVRRCNPDLELPRIVNYGVTIAESTTMVKYYKNNRENY